MKFKTNVHLEPKFVSYYVDKIYEDMAEETASNVHLGQDAMEEGSKSVISAAIQALAEDTFRQGCRETLKRSYAEHNN